MALSILTLNVQGSQNSLKRFQIINFVKITCKQISCLQYRTHILFRKMKVSGVCCGEGLFFQPFVN